MPIEPFAWNVIVAGAWNPAILTPDGVRRRLFDLADGIPLQIEVAIDRPGPFRIGHEDLVVVTTTTQLEIGARNATPELLRRACGLCQRALIQLPETPVSAAGVNIRYRTAEFPDRFLDLLRAPLDGVLGDAGHEIQGGSTKRSIHLPPGRVNLTITQADAGGKIELNFHKESTDATVLRDWLGRVDEFLTRSDELTATVGLEHVGREIHA